MRSLTTKANQPLEAQVAAYWTALIVANLACLGLMALLFFR